MSLIKNIFPGQSACDEEHGPQPEEDHDRCEHYVANDRLPPSSRSAILRIKSEVEPRMLHRPIGPKDDSHQNHQAYYAQEQIRPARSPPFDGARAARDVNIPVHIGLLSHRELELVTSMQIQRK